jgi:kynurenine formamidase
MIANLKINDNNYSVLLSNPIKASIELVNGSQNPNCFYAPIPQIEPVVANDFIGDVNQGGSVNFYNIAFNPHGNGTHTECVGHIASEKYYIKDCTIPALQICQLISVQPTIINQDSIITVESLSKIVFNKNCTAIAIRTLPNNEDKLTQQYSNTNPTFIAANAMEFIVSLGIQHLILDIPSVDREQDNGLLQAHHIFWNYPSSKFSNTITGLVRDNATITELAFFPNTMLDNIYAINIQTMPIALDACSSNIVFYPISESVL